MKRYIIPLLILISALILSSCGQEFKEGVPSGFAGTWRCEEKASDGKTDTSFYELHIDEDGKFSMYDFAAGNPGISGKMGNDTGERIGCRFDMDDFDVPLCWDISSDRAKLSYELTDDTLRLCHNGVWMTFHRYEETDPELIPEPLDELIKIDVPEGCTPEMEYEYLGQEGMPVVQKAWSGKDLGYFSAGILSYKGYGCLDSAGEEKDIDGYIDRLSDRERISIGDASGWTGTMESEETPDMAAVCLIQHGEYAFEFRLTNGDEQITEEQMKAFRKILGSLKLKY